MKKALHVLKEIVFLMVLPMFLLGATIFAENIVEWNIGNMVIGFLLVVISAICFTFVLISER